jgi:hypothetical protein
MGCGVADREAFVVCRGLARSGAKLEAIEVGFKGGEVYVLYEAPDAGLDGFCQSSPKRSSIAGVAVNCCCGY